MAQFDTLIKIIGDVSIELGLGQLITAGTMSTNAYIGYVSSDTNINQLLHLAKAVGRKLTMENPWLQQVVSYTFTTTTATTYPMPLDFLAMVDGTGWNRTTRQPLRPVTPQHWEALQALTTLSTMPVIFRPTMGADAGFANWVYVLEFLTAPTSGQTIALEYRSRYWISATASGTAATLDTFNGDANEIRIDAHLFSRALKLAWKQAKGFDSTAEQRDFDDALQAMRAHNASSRETLSLSGRKGYGRLINWANIPETGYGS